MTSSHSMNEPNGSGRSDDLRRKLAQVVSAGSICLGLAIVPGCGTMQPAAPSVWATHQQEIRGQEPGIFTSLRDRIIAPTATELVQRAADQYRQGQTEAALTTLRRARRVDPTLITSWELEAEITLDTGDADNCRTALRALQDANPQSARTHFSVGQKLQQLGDTERAITAFERAHKLEPRRAEYTRQLAAAHLSTGDRQSATVVLTRGLQLAPSDLQLATLAARLHEEEGRFREAAEAYSRAVAADPKNMQWRRHRGRCMYQLGIYEQAAGDMAAVYLHDRNLLTVVDFIYYGDACLRINDVYSARVVFDDLATNHPQRMREVELMRGLCAIKQQRISDAHDIISSALARWPGDPQLTQLMGYCRGDHESGTTGDSVALVSFEKEAAATQAKTDSAPARLPEAATKAEPIPGGEPKWWTADPAKPAELRSELSPPAHMPLGDIFKSAKVIQPKSK